MARLAAAIDQHVKRPAGCSVGALLTGLPKADAADLRAALDAAVPAAAICNGLLDHAQVKIGASTIRRHRRRECECAE